MLCLLVAEEGRAARPKFHEVPESILLIRSGDSINFTLRLLEHPDQFVGRACTGVGSVTWRKVTFVFSSDFPD